MDTGKSNVSGLLRRRAQTRRGATGSGWEAAALRIPTRHVFTCLIPLTLTKKVAPDKMLQSCKKTLKNGLKEQVFPFFSPLKKSTNSLKSQRI